MRDYGKTPGAGPVGRRARHFLRISKLISAGIGYPYCRPVNRLSEARRGGLFSGLTA